MFLRLLFAGISAGLMLLVPIGVTLDVSAQGGAGQTSIDAILRQAVEHGDVPGVVAVATNRSRIIYSGAFGLAEASTGRPMKTDTIFRIASMTKAITSVAAMQLVEQRKIRLDDPVSKYLKQFDKVSVLSSFDVATGAYTVESAGKPVTVRHLLTHTSGLGYSFTSATVRDFKPKNGDTFEIGPLMFQPGDQWLYGTSTEWLGRLVEAVSGQTLDAYFKDHITGLLGMADTFFNVPPPDQGRLVNLWRRSPEGALSERPRRAPNVVTEFDGDGGLSSTALDYIKFVRMILNDGQDRGVSPVSSVRILSSAAVAEMSRNQIGAVSARALKTALPATSADFSFINDGRDKWGLGFLISMEARPGLRSLGSLSWGGLYNSYFWIDQTKGIGGVIMMQFLPFADSKALATYEAFERAVYAAN